MERRRDSRQAVTWPVRLWLTETCFLPGHLVNATLHGGWVHLNWLQSEILKLGETYRLDVWLPGAREERVCVAVVRHVNRYGAGLEILDELPVPGQDSSAAQSRRTAPCDGVEPRWVMAECSRN